MITGARQTGKTYVVRKYAREHFENIVEINFIENENAVGLFENVRSSADILLRISALTDVPLEKGKTVPFVSHRWRDAGRGSSLSSNQQPEISA